MLDNYKINKEHATDGVRMELPEGNWIKMRYAGASNAAYAKSLQEVLKPYRRSINQISAEEDRKLLATVYAQSIVVDWGGPDFKDKPFNEINFVTLMTDLPEFFVDIQEMAGTMRYFADEYVEDTVKNS